MGEDGKTTHIFKCLEHDRCFDAINAKLDAILAKVSAHSSSLKMDNYRLNLHEKLLFGATGAVLAAFMGGAVYLVFRFGTQT